MDEVLIVTPNADVDKEYRKKSIHRMFMGALFTGLGGGAFFGVLNNLINITLEAIKDISVTGTAVAGLSLTGGLVMGGMMAVGVACTYMAQREWTALRELQDDRLAQKNAEYLVKQKGRTVGTAVKVQEKKPEYEENQRADGKTWQQVVESSKTLTGVGIH